MAELDMNEDLRRYREEQEAEVQAELDALEAEKEFNRINKVRNENGSIAKVGGRPLGRKNNSTLFKEAMRQGFEERLEADGLKVFDAVVQKAIGPQSRDKDGELLFDKNGKPMYLDGDTTAQKMIMDRIVPVMDMDKVSGKEKFNININVHGMKGEVDVMDGEYETIEEG